MSSDSLVVDFPDWGSLTLTDAYARCYLGDLAGLARYSLKMGVLVRRVSLLHIASYVGHDHVVEWILQQPDSYFVETHLFEPDWYGRLPFHVALQRGHTRCVEHMVSKFDTSGMLLDACCQADRDGDTPLHSACRYGRVDCLRAIRQRASPKMYLKNYNRAGRTPLEEACFWGQTDCVREMMTWLNGAPGSLEYRMAGSADPGVNAMYIAIRQGHVAALEVMCEWIHYSSGNVFGPRRHLDAWGEAVVHGHVSILDWLRSKGAETGSKHRLLHLACDSGQAGALRWLLTWSLDIVSPREVRFFKPSLSLETLLSQKSPESDNTPLHVACACRRVECVDAILEAWPEARDCIGKNAYGMTPYDLAAGCPEIRSRVLPLRKRIVQWAASSRRLSRSARRLCSKMN